LAAANGLRRGKWTAEEENYALRLIEEFKLGLLPLTDGTTLRTFLSKLLFCDPMRISKKFVGGNCIGKQVFRRRNADADALTAEQIEKSRKELADLERRFLERISQGSRSRGGGGGGGNGASNGVAGMGLSTLLMAKATGDGDGGGLLAPWMVPQPEGNGAAPGRSHGAGFNGTAKPRGRGKAHAAHAPIVDTHAAPYTSIGGATMPQLSLDTVTHIASLCGISSAQLQGALKYYHETYNQPLHQQPQSADECEAAIQHIQVLQTISNAVAQMQQQHQQQMQMHMQMQQQQQHLQQHHHHHHQQTGLSWAMDPAYSAAPAPTFAHAANGHYRSSLGR
jgi:hypothetical protein